MATRVIPASPILKTFPGEHALQKAHVVSDPGPS